MIPPCQRITIVFEVLDTGVNEAIALTTLVQLLGALHHDGIYPHRLSLAVAPAPST
ncbi:MAG: hypothetical protein ACRDX8_11285 [Acidimicrobiales bacterium]